MVSITFNHVDKRKLGKSKSLLLQKNRGQSGGIAGLDLNVDAAWGMGFTGKGVTTAIMDDG